VIDSATWRDYKGCSRRAFVAVVCCCSRLFRPEFRSCRRSSALDGVGKPSSLLTGSICDDRAFDRVWRTPAYRGAALLLGGIGVLAFLLSAVLPDDDALQQECLHGRASVRVVGRHTREVAGTAVSVHLSTVFWPAARTVLVRPCGATYPLYFAPIPSCGQFQSTIGATRAPPTSA
jgi:hypothetical protein